MTEWQTARSAALAAEMAREVEAWQLAIAEQLAPAFEGAADAMHLFWYGLLPWHRRWWHLVTGHRRRGYCLTHPIRAAR